MKHVSDHRSDLHALRDQIDRDIADARHGEASVALRRLWKLSPQPATAAFVCSRFEELRRTVSLTEFRVAILRSFTVEPVIPLLRAMAFVGGIDLQVHLGDFNTYAQDILDPASSFYARVPQAVFLAALANDVAPELWERFADLDAEAIASAERRIVSQFGQLIATFRANSNASLVVHTFQRPPRLPAGESAQLESFARINNAIVAATRDHRGVYTLDYDGLVARRGHENWTDERKWFTSRMPIAAGELVHLASEWMRFIHPLAGRICKVLAVDLDNTLWGGVIGEDGIDGIKLDDGYPGGAFRAVQRAMLDLHRRGILLAICSKNNPAEALDAMRGHPGMLLRPEHFAAMRINWTDKATNLREIAAELNVGIDSIAFLDDNPLEREWVAARIPEITIVDLPEDPIGFASALRSAAVFGRLEITDEDRSRGQAYAEQRKRNDLASGAKSLEDFYRDLNMAAEIAPVNPATVRRATQLTQKTNQFNLTTRRYTETEVSTLLDSPDWRLYTLRVTDRFGDNGIVGVAFVRQSAPELCEIDTFLLSCRVIGRTVETALLAAVARDALHNGARRLVGSFIPTYKNAPAEDFFAAHGFTRIPEGAAEGSRWELSLPANELSCPPWINATVAQGLPMSRDIVSSGVAFNG